MNCDWKCPETCVACTDDFTCTKCDASKNRKLNSVTALCDCESGYIENEKKECMKCNIVNGICIVESLKGSSKDSKKVEYNSLAIILVVTFSVLLLLTILFIVYLYFKSKKSDMLALTD